MLFPFTRAIDFSKGPPGGAAFQWFRLVSFPPPPQFSKPIYIVLEGHAQLHEESGCKVHLPYIYGGGGGVPQGSFIGTEAHSSGL